MLIFAGGHKSWSLVSAMQHLGMHVVATGTEKSTEEDKARIRALMGPEAHMIVDNDQTSLLRSFHEEKADILIAGDRYIYPALKARVPFLDVDHVRSIGYAGYAGAIELANNLAVTLHSPVWQHAKQRAALGAAGGLRAAAWPKSSPRKSRSRSTRSRSASRWAPRWLSWGSAQAMPLEHGARGCTSFNKLFFMRHFQEPIALQTTAMDQIAAVIGADGNVVEALRTIAEKNAPEIIGLITTALAETQGADIPRTVRAFRERYPEHTASPSCRQRQRHAGMPGDRLRRGGRGDHRRSGARRRSSRCGGRAR